MISQWAKLSNGLSSKEWGITRELDKKPSLHYSFIYTTTLWSMLQQCVYLMSIHHAFSSCHITHPHVFSLRLLCFLYVLWCHTFNLRYTCVHHVYTMRNPCPLTSLLTLTLYLDSITWLPGHVLSIHCRLIIILSYYVWLTLTLAKVCPHSHLITIFYTFKRLPGPLIHYSLLLWLYLVFSDNILNILT